jgi:hypothetical protein
VKLLAQSIVERPDILTGPKMAGERLHGSMKRQLVDSREYKIVLQARKFDGSQDQLMRKAEEFWRVFEQAISSPEVSTRGHLDEIDTRRTIRFLDTAGYLLNNNSYLFRERFDIDKKERQFTLKFRHPDRYVAHDREMKIRKRKNKKPKFEEDLKPSFQERPPYITLYSFSNTGEIPSYQKLTTMGKLVEQIPSLGDALDGYDENDALLTVGNFTALEIVLKGGFFGLDNSSSPEAECALIVWYDGDKEYDENDNNRPRIVEFSFRYDQKKEKYTREFSQLAWDVYSKLQKLSWVDRASKSKTEYMYTLAESDGA